MRVSRLLALPLALSFAAVAAAQSLPSPQSPTYSFPTKPLLAEPNNHAPAPNPLLNDLARDAARRFTELSPLRRTSALTPQRCYTIRDYSFSRDDPQSDALRLNSYTACEPSTEARVLHTTVGPAGNAAR